MTKLASFLNKINEGTNKEKPRAICSVGKGDGAGEKNLTSAPKTHERDRSLLQGSPPDLQRGLYGLKHGAPQERQPSESGPKFTIVLGERKEIKTCVLGGGIAGFIICLFCKTQIYIKGKSCALRRGWGFWRQLPL